jgi:hypothetical protein
MNTFLSILAILLGNLSGAFIASPPVEVELVRTPIRHDQTDIYVLVTNPNDFSIYVPGGISTNTITMGNATGYGCGPPFNFPDGFVVLEPGERRLFQLRRNCPLKKGINNLHVKFGHSVANHDGIQPYRVVVNYPELDMRIVNE